MTVHIVHSTIYTEVVTSQTEDAAVNMEAAMSHIEHCTSHIEVATSHIAPSQPTRCKIETIEPTEAYMGIAIPHIKAVIDHA